MCCVDLWTLDAVDTPDEQFIEFRWAVAAYLAIPDPGDTEDQHDRICVRERLQELVNEGA